MSDVLIIHSDGFSSYHGIYDQLHRQITSLYTANEVRCNAEARLALDATPKPKAVLLVDGCISDQKYSKTMKKVITYAKNGGTVITCMNFTNFLTPSRFEEIFNEDFGLSWELGDYTRQTAVLNAMFNDTFSKPLVPSYSMKALHISKASQHCRVYAYPKGSEALTEMYHQSPVVLERYTETGFIGWVGDVNNEHGSQVVILSMLGESIFSSGVSRKLKLTYCHDLRLTS